MARPSVLVLGAGFIGSAVAGALFERGCAVSVITRSELLAERLERLGGASVFVGDALETGTLASALGGIDHVVYAVGTSSPVESDLDPANDVALIAPPLIRLLELLRLRPRVGLTFLSSGGTVYGDHGLASLPESAPTRPISSYGIIKLTCENYISMYADVHGVPARILRVSNAYGPGQIVARGQGLVARLVRCAVTGEPMPLYGSPDAVRDYIFIDDIAQIVAELVCTRDVPQVLNVGSGIGRSVADVIAMVEDVAGTTISLQSLPHRGCDVPANVLDISALRAVVPFEPLDLRSGLERTWKALLAGDVPEPRPPAFPLAASR